MDASRALYDNLYDNTLKKSIKVSARELCCVALCCVMSHFLYVEARLSQLHALDHKAVNPQERKYCEEWWRTMMMMANNNDDGGGIVSTRKKIVFNDAGVNRGDVGDEGGCEGECGGFFPEGNNWPVWVLHEVFTRGGLTTKEVTYCAQCSSVWREGAAGCLAMARRKEADALMEAALPALHAAEGTLQELTWHDFEDLRSNHIPLRPLVHLFYCLGTVWPLFWDEAFAATALLATREKQRKKQKSAIDEASENGGGSVEGIESGGGGGRGEGRDDTSALVMTDGSGRGDEDNIVTTALAASNGVSDITAAAAALIFGEGGGGGGIGGGGGGTRRNEEDAWLAAAMAASVADAGSRPPFSSSSLEERRLPSPPPPPPPSLPLPPEPSSAAAAAAASAARSFFSDENSKIDLDNATWRAQAWSIVVEPMLRSPRFPGLFTHCPDRVLPRPDRLAKLRASTGSADDMEDYVPLLSTAAVRRAHDAAGRLAEWLMAQEAYAHARLCVDRASGGRRVEGIVG